MVDGIDRMIDFSDLTNRLTKHFSSDTESFCKEIVNEPDGEYNCMFYAYTLEFPNGNKYGTNIGVRRTRRHSSYDFKVKVVNGNVYEL